MSHDLAPLLQDRASITALDPHGILALTDGFVEQCQKAEAIGRAASLPTLASLPRNVVLTGLGGSAAGGDFVKSIFEESGKTNFLVNRDYSLPGFIGEGDLVFCASYSGNTEETLSAYAHAVERGATIVVISSGGELTELAQKAGYSVISVPGGQPPRTAMGWMMTPVLVACERLGLIATQDFEGAWAGLAEGRALWTAEVELAANPAKQLAIEFLHKVPVLYGLGGPQAVVANRIKCQIHENSKAMAHSNGFPELNHNEILAWNLKGKASEIGRWTGLLLTFGDESTKMKARAQTTFDLIGALCPFHNAEAKGSTLLAKMLWLAFFGDYISVYLARLREVDPEDIGMINALKEALAKISA